MRRLRRSQMGLSLNNMNLRIWQFNIKDQDDRQLGQRNPKSHKRIKNQENQEIQNHLKELPEKLFEQNMTWSRGSEFYQSPSDLSFEPNLWSNFPTPGMACIASHFIYRIQGFVVWPSKQQEAVLSAQHLIWFKRNQKILEAWRNQIDWWRKENLTILRLNKSIFGSCPLATCDANWQYNTWTNRVPGQPSMFNRSVHGSFNS